MNAQRGFAFIPLLIGAISIPVIGFFGFKYGDVLLVNSHVQQVKRAIAQQDIDAAIQTYLKHLENPAFLDRMGPLSEEVKYYMNYKRALEIYTTDSRPDYQYILGLLEGMPEDFAYRNKVISMREYSRQRLQNTQKSSVAGATTQRPAPQPPANKIDCTGPDGKHMYDKTQKQCDDFNRAWGNINTTQQNTTYSPSSVQNTLIDCDINGQLFKKTPSLCEYLQWLAADVRRRAALIEQSFQPITAPDLGTVPTYGPIPDIAGSVQAEMDKSLQGFQDSQQMGTTCSSQGVCPAPTSVPAWFDSVP